MSNLTFELEQQKRENIKDDTDTSVIVGLSRGDSARIVADLQRAKMAIAALQQSQSTLSGDIRAAKEFAAQRAADVGNTVQAQDELSVATAVGQLAQTVAGQIARLNMLINVNFDKHVQIGQALSENVVLDLDSASENVSAALLNAAAAGTLQKTVHCTLSYMNDAGDQIAGTHEWASFLTPVTGGNTGCWNPDVKWIPDAASDPRLVDGEVDLLVTFATDGGSTKVYQIGDTVTVEIQVAADDKWFGLTVPAVTKTFHVIA
jgi:hypothetical protein